MSEVKDDGVRVFPHINHFSGNISTSYFANCQEDSLRDSSLLRVGPKSRGGLFQIIWLLTLIKINNSIEKLAEVVAVKF